MKHIKTYESKLINYKYKKGDYIKLEDENYWNVYLVAKIVDRQSAQALGNPDIEDYRIETFKLSNNEMEKFWVDFGEIDRKATKEEIEQFKLVKITNKYNL